MESMMIGASTAVLISRRMDDFGLCEKHFLCRASGGDKVTSLQILFAHGFQIECTAHAVIKDKKSSAGCRSAASEFPAVRLRSSYRPDFPALTCRRDAILGSALIVGLT